MASSTLFEQALFFLLSPLFTSYIAQAGDPDILTDFIVPTNSSTPIDGNSFTFTGMRGLPTNSTNPPNFKVTKATMAKFPALNGQTNKLYTQTLQFGDMFVFPKGLVHYQYNADSSKQATAISTFGSANAGTVSAPVTLFATGIDDVVLAKSFKTDVGTIQKIKAGVAAKP
ncbi:Germin-like protein 9-3 [Camellia lanceoleosa]|uniref:Germin-like protein 9-3 n=1 Tax=Camellia lanceoleosa TaxID=1840588 RepID=A0ACC0F0T4_9ERIC|nr:Germin-like protein 9-3 [Camellia lanceoleosa]